MLQRLFVPAANHLLGQAEWATARLKMHAGRQARVRIAPWELHLRITPEGLLAPGDPAAPSDVFMEMPPATFARWLSQRDAAARAATVSGDAALAEALSFVAANLEWDFEEDLSRLTGDVAAHRIGEALRAFRQWRVQFGVAVRANVAEYLTEERQVLPTRLQADMFLQAVDELRDAAERLEKRLERLEQARRS